MKITPQMTEGKPNGMPLEEWFHITGQKKHKKKISSSDLDQNYKEYREEPRWII